jgi:hypothetical protein
LLSLSLSLSLSGFHCPTILNGKWLAITSMLVETKVNALPGVFVRRELIIDPREYPSDDRKIDTISVTVLTVDDDDDDSVIQRPLAIAHFLEDGTLVRAQANNGKFGRCFDVDADYFATIAKWDFASRKFQRIDTSPTSTSLASTPASSSSSVEQDSRKRSKRF